MKLVFLVNIIGVLIVCFGFLGAYYNRGSLVLYFMVLELLLLGINTLYILVSFSLDDIQGLIISFYILTVSASEVAVGLGLLVSYFISQMDISVNYMRLLRW